MSMVVTFLQIGWLVEPIHPSVVRWLHVGEDLLDVHTVGVVGGTVGSLKAWLLKGLWAHPFLDHHVLRFTKAGIATGLLQVLVGGQVLAAPYMEVLGLLLTFGLPVVEVVEVGHYDGHW